jgi:hypothetical protein
MEPLYNRPKDTFTHVIFLNDILFCQQDIFRLLVYGADMACGLDFDVGFRDTWVGRTIDGREMVSVSIRYLYRIQCVFIEVFTVEIEKETTIWNTQSQCCNGFQRKSISCVFMLERNRCYQC